MKPTGATGKKKKKKRSSRWNKKCIKIKDRSVMLVKWVHRFLKGSQSVHEWKVMNRSREGFKWDVRKKNFIYIKKVWPRANKNMF